MNLPTFPTSARATPRSAAVAGIADTGGGHAVLEEWRRALLGWMPSDRS